MGGGEPTAFVIVCDAGAIVAPDAVTVDALARLALAARRAGCWIRLRNASPELQGLVSLMGLSEVLPVECPELKSL